MLVNRKEIIFVALSTLFFGAVAGSAWYLLGISSLPVSMTVLLGQITAMAIGLHRRTSNRFDGVHQDLDHAYRQLEALSSLTSCLKLDAPLPRMQGWTITPEFANILVSLIREYRPERVVEAGSGVSTLISAYALRQYNGGKLVSLDHENDFAATTRTALRRHGLEERAAVRDAPLTAVVIGGRSWRWYDPAALVDLGPIDLLVIDGPPASLGADARYPAMPLLMPQLSAEAVIILDDCRRRGEQQVVDRWLAEFRGFTREYIDTQKGTIVLRRKSAV
jgi:predicted O-methyltransferase YrrM